MGRRHKPHLRCSACRLHASVCICALLPRIETRTHVALVVHQLEARKPTNTGLLAVRCLRNAAVAYRGRPISDDAPGLDELSDGAALVPAGTRPVILYPHEGALPVEEFQRSPTP